MEKSNLSYSELVHYLDLTATDPLVRRLINLIHEGEGTIINELLEEGMDGIYNTFYHDGANLTPGEYIDTMRREISNLESDLECLRDDFDDVTEERDKLKTRTVADLLASMEEQVKRAHAETMNVQQIARKIEQENLELKDKINVWTIMER